MKSSNSYQAMEGRRRRFEEAVGPHLPALRKAALAILRSEDLADDAVQETLLRAWRYSGLPEAPKGVLLTLVRRSCLHILRCSRRRADHEYFAGSEHSRCCCSMDPAGAAGGPVASAMTKDELGAAVVATANLTREHREVLGLVGLRGLSYREAAGALGVPVGTVRSRTSRARVALQKLLDEGSVETPSC